MPKTVILTESQWDMLLNLLESDSGAPDYDDGDIKEFPGSEVSTTAVVHDTDGDPKYGKAPTTDKVAGELTNQRWMQQHLQPRGPITH